MQPAKEIVSLCVTICHLPLTINGSAPINTISLVPVTGSSFIVPTLLTILASDIIDAIQPHCVCVSGASSGVSAVVNSTMYVDIQPSMQPRPSVQMLAVTAASSWFWYAANGGIRISSWIGVRIWEQ